MRDLVFRIITAAAEAAGLPEGRVMDLSRADNITIPRPRLEVQILSARFQRTGRRLAAMRDGKYLTRKKERYEVRQSVSVNVLGAPEGGEDWLSAFGYAFAQSLPRTVNDARGNLVRISIAEATPGGKAAPRVGLASIDPMPKRNQLFKLDFVWRVTEEEQAALITDITISTHWRHHGQKD